MISVMSNSNKLVRFFFKMANNDDACAKCLKKINKRTTSMLQCDGEKCRKSFHKSCTSVSNEEYTEISKENGKFWFCSNCVVTMNRRKSGHVALNKTKNLSTPSPSTSISNINNNENDKNISLSDIDKKLDKLCEQQKNDICELKQLLEHYRASIDLITQENIELRNDNEKLHQRIRGEKINFECFKQESLNHTVEICGLNLNDKSQSEFEEEVLNTLAQLDDEFSKDQVQEIYINDVINSKSVVPKVNIKFYKKINRSRFIAKCKRVRVSSNNKNQLIIKSVDKVYENNIDKNNKANINERPIYVNEPLTSYFSYLYKKCRDCKKAGKIKYVWIKEGKLFIREKDKSRTINVVKVDDIISINNNDS